MPFNLDLRRYREWTLDHLYYLLFSRLMRDFVYREDYEAAMADGNMMAGDSPVTFTLMQPSANTLARIKAREYEALAEVGDVGLSTAQETGTTTGVEG